ncbi:MAG TPA: PDZ domain-containing protein [Blastocatellia bacterium]|nr:PDZ domain-containing protein [Blastocatellia bacterium]
MSRSTFMSSSIRAILILMFSSAALAQSPQPPQGDGKVAVPWAVSVVHTIDVQKMVALMREQPSLRVGVAGSAPRYIYNVTTGLVVDDQGHVVTRLSNLDLADKDQKLSVSTNQGMTLEAKLIGIDLATGFAVLDVAYFKSTMPRLVTVSGLLNGAPVKILSTDVIPTSTSERVYLSPAITVSEGHVAADSMYSKARGALTLLSESLLARCDSSVVVTPENQVVGMAQYAGFGRAYLYPIDFIRDTIAKRVIEKNDNVPAGWLGVTGDSLTQLSDSDFAPLGLQRRAGVIVRQVTSQSAAAQAGIVPNDVIIGLDDFDIAGAADLKATLSTLPAGRSIKLRAIRNHQPVEIKAVLGPRPNSEPVYLLTPFDQPWEAASAQRDQLDKRLEELTARFRAYHNSPPSRETNEAIRELEIEIRHIYDSLRALGPETGAATPKPVQQASRQTYPDAQFTGEQDVSFRAGFTARALNPQLAATLQARGGVLISSVAKNSQAERAGLKAGDVIIGSQERVLMSAAQLQALLSSQRSPISLKVVRNKEAIVVSLNLE